MASLYSVLETVYGPAVAWADEDGALTFLTFNPVYAQDRIAADGDRRDDAILAPVGRQLAEYSAGRRHKFDLPLRLRGTPFQQAVWQALTEIPLGETTTYGKLAEKLGRPGSARAVGAANGANPVMLIVPCHRVIGADGSLTGFGGGLPLKARMLAFEREHARAPDDLFSIAAQA
jgi:methylated-DNA-[protein]-cysteine S-methyltransferase